MSRANRDGETGLPQSLDASTTPPRVLIVGDVHGCVDELEDLVARFDPRSEDQVVLVGDLVRKGPYSARVIEFIRAIGARSVMGNHDRYAVRLWDTGSVTELEAHHVAFLRELPRTIWLPEYNVRVVHAGLLPGLDMAQQSEETLLFVRSIRPDGTPARNAQEGVPWASLWRGPEHIVFGHDALRGFQSYPLATGIDTGCVYGNKLTGLVLPTHTLISVPAKRRYIS
ncbi:MAG: metallophosphoesterase [Myxococcota bacterium]